MNFRMVKLDFERESMIGDNDETPVKSVWIPKRDQRCIMTWAILSFLGYAIRLSHVASMHNHSKCRDGTMTF